MDTSDLILIGISVCSLLYGAVQQYRSSDAQANRDNKNAVWRRLDEQKEQIAGIKELIRSEYVTRGQMHEYFSLSTKAWIVKLDHIDKQISELKQFFEKRFP